MRRTTLALTGLLAMGAAPAWGGPGETEWTRGAPAPTQVQTGPQADALARRIQAATGLDAWEALEAVAWTFRGKRTHLWDKRRNLARVRWDTHEVLLDVGARTGRASTGGQPVQGAVADALVAQAWSMWVNDSYWLYPFRTFFHEGVTRATAVDHEGKPGLLVTYGQGGVTPGDKYLWRVGPDGRPDQWRMWVQVRKVGGLKATWTAWKTVGGVPFSTRHGGRNPEVEVQGAGPLAQIAPGPDPFAALVIQAPVASAPTSQPMR